jgi:nucleoside 2-deoxyribosyltransferase
MKYKPLIEATLSKLQAFGITPIFPNLEESSKDIRTLALEHFGAIDESDAVYILTPYGYMGTSCKVELGYSVARNKPIYFSEPTNDESLDCYALKFITSDNFEDFLK